MSGPDDADRDDSGNDDNSDSGWGDYSGTGESSEEAITDDWGKDSTH